MGIFNLFKKNNKKSKILQNPYENEEKQIELEERRVLVAMQKMEIKKLEHQQRLNEMKRIKENLMQPDDFEDYDDDDDDFGDLGEIGKLLSPIIGNLGGNPIVSSPIENQSPHPQTKPSNISDDDLREFIAKQDRKHISIAKKMPKSMLINRAKKEGVINTDEEGERAYQILITEF